jgi:hypothetical protein
LCANGHCNRNQGPKSFPLRSAFGHLALSPWDSLFAVGAIMGLSLEPESTTGKPNLAPQKPQSQFEILCKVVPFRNGPVSSYKSDALLILSSLSLRRL